MKKTNLWDLGILLLGVGIGIIISVSIFYYNPIVKYKEYSNDQIIEKYTEIMLKSQREEEKNKSNIKKENNKEEKSTNKEVEFIIDEGESLDSIVDNLYKSKIIDNKSTFLDRLKVTKATEKIQYGKYKINTPITYDNLIDKIIIK